MQRKNYSAEKGSNRGPSFGAGLVKKTPDTFNDHQRKEAAYSGNTPEPEYSKAVRSDRAPPVPAITVKAQENRRLLKILHQSRIPARLIPSKILYWDKNGFCLWQKRLEKDHFKWPENQRRSARQTDGYGGYNFLDKNTDIVHVACWVHARRKFKAVTNALKYISELYKKDAV